MSTPPQNDNPGIVAFGPGAWHAEEVFGSPRYHLWNLAGLGWPVVYIEPPHKMRAIQRVWHAKDREFHVLSASMVIPFAPRMVKSEEWGEKWRAWTSRELLKRGLTTASGLRVQPSVVWCGAPWHSLIMENAPEGSLRVSHTYDELSLSPALNELQRGLLWGWERELAQASHVALCSSTRQVERRKNIAPRTFLLENAVSDDFFTLPSGQILRPDLAEQLARLANTPEPRFIYGGVADHRLDPQFFKAILENIPTGSLIFLGKKDPSLDPELAQELSSNPRVHFFGEIKYSDFPHYYRYANVLLIAHRRSEFTDSMYPEKLNEYLASGKPIVSVCLPEVGRIAREATHPGTIRTADSPWDFLREASVAMNDNDPILQEERIKIARGHSWSLAAQRLDRELRGELDRRQRERIAAAAKAEARRQGA